MSTGSTKLTLRHYPKQADQNLEKIDSQSGPTENRSPELVFTVLTAEANI